MYNLIFNISIINHLSLMKTTGVDFQGGERERLTIAISLIGCGGDIFVADPMPFSMKSTFYPPRPVVGISHHYSGCQTARCSKITTRILVSGGRKVATRPTHDDRMKSPVDTLGGPVHLVLILPCKDLTGMYDRHKTASWFSSSINTPSFTKTRCSCGRVARRWEKWLKVSLLSGFIRFISND